MKKHLRRSNWTKMVMTDLVITSVNAITEDELIDEAVAAVIAPSEATLGTKSPYFENQYRD